MTKRVRPDDPALDWAGAVDVQHTGRWSQAWRLPRARRSLYPPPLLDRAGMAAGVRIRFRTDSTTVAGRVHEPPSGLSPVDLVADGALAGTERVADDGRFAFRGLPAGDKAVELWLPQFGHFRLAGLELDPGARVRPPEPAAGAPRLLTYGSSITQCRQAASPTRTWPAIVARRLGCDLTSFGFGGQCHLDPWAARAIRDRPADLVTLCAGINIYRSGSFSRRTFAPAFHGFLDTVREGHPGTPVLVISPLHAPGHETVPGEGGMTLEEVRGELSTAVARAAALGDSRLHYLDGLSLLGTADADLLVDGLHPGDCGYRTIAERITPHLEALLAPADDAGGGPR